METTTSASAQNATATTAKRLTALGTPCSPAWDDEWIATIDEVEAKRGTHICGARTLCGTPCALAPQHQNGRCRFHGGFNLTGAQPGNRNAVVHGLYARSVQTCGNHCPMWKTCPMAARDVQDLPAAERPKCPYETAHYEAAATDNLARLNFPEDADPSRRHLAHHVAMVQVMVLRAAGAMAVNEMSDLHIVTPPSTLDRKRNHPSIYFEAFMRLSAELRRCITLMQKEKPDFPSHGALREQRRRAQHDTTLLPEDQIHIDANYTSMSATANADVNAAIKSLSQNDLPKARRSMEFARKCDPVYIEAMLNPTSPHYNSQLAPLAAPP